MIRASVRELLEAYTEAVTHNRDNAEFWRACVLERMELLNVAVADYERTRGVDSTQSEGS